MDLGLASEYANFVESRTKKLATLADNLHHAATGMSTESGETLDTTKKIWVYGQDLTTVNKEGKTHRQNLEEELGDTLFYIQAMCNLLGVSLATIVRANMDKLNKRYPTGYSDKAAAERADKK